MCMKVSNLILGWILLASPALADRYSGPLLVMKKGALAHQGKVINCEIYANHPGLVKDFDKIYKLIEAAAKTELKTAMHIAPANPSIEFYAFRAVEVPGSPKVKGEEILLKKDYSVLETREGKEAEQLLEKIKKLCSE